MEELVVRLVRQSLFLVLIASAPAMAAALFIGLIISFAQAITQLQEQTLSYVPKIVAVFLVLLMILPWLFAQIVQFANHAFLMIPRI
jgi:flagellar biosynthesis protein FliQ